MLKGLFAEVLKKFQKSSKTINFVVCLSVSMSKEMKYVKYRKRFFDMEALKIISIREIKLCTIVIQAEQPTINE